MVDNKKSLEYGHEAMPEVMKKVFDSVFESYHGEEFQTLQDTFFDILPHVKPDM